jgi:hypothetical protein
MPLQWLPLKIEVSPNPSLSESKAGSLGFGVPVFFSVFNNHSQGAGNVSFLIYEAGTYFLSFEILQLKVPTQYPILVQIVSGVYFLTISYKNLGLA